MVNAEFLGNLSRCFERIIFDGCHRLVVVNFRRVAAPPYLRGTNHITTAKSLVPTPYRRLADVFFALNCVDMLLTFGAVSNAG